MHSRHGRCCGVVLFLAAVSVGRSAAAQDPLDNAQPRQLAPGVLTVIPTGGGGGDTFTGPVSLVEITTGIPELDWTPHYEPRTQTLLGRASRVTFYRTAWHLEFAFKPLRMIEVDVPQPEGQTQRKRIWYLVYRVKNVGYDIRPVLREEIPGLKTAELEAVNFATRRFFPHMVLESHEFKKQYLDRIIHAAKRPIQLRENPGVELYNSIEITSVPIPLSDERVDRSVWGFATWEDIDPRIDFFSIYVRGLTNSYQFADPPGAFKPGDPPGTGRQFSFKTLQLNFWRPGDTHFLHEREITFGVPIETDAEKQRVVLEKYGLKQRLDYLWVYR
jgi:hypothetical protein